MKNEEIIKAAEEEKMAAKVAENYEEGDFFIGCKIDEVLPNGKTSTLVCVDCSWLNNTMGFSPIISVEDLDAIEESVETTDSIEMKRQLDELVFVKWMDMVDMDGDIHHCKVESYVELSTDVLHPVADTDYVVYVEV